MEMKKDFNVNIELSNNSINFREKNRDNFVDYINNLGIIFNQGSFSILNDKMFEFNKNLNFNNYDFSERFLNLRVIMSLLKIFNLTNKNTYEIFEFFDNNKQKYNIWKYLNDTEYIHCDAKSNYNKSAIIRICLSYSWKECLYNLLNEILNKSCKNFKVFIWIDIFCVNQFNEKIKKKGLDKIKNVYYIADIYIISSLKAFSRYWCCYEMSLEKKAIDGILISRDDFYRSDIHKQKLDEIFNKIFINTISLYEENS